MGWLTGLSIKTYIYAAVAIVIAGMALGLRIQTSRLATSKAETVKVQASFDLFKEEVKQAGDAAEKARQKDIIDRQAISTKKEAENAKRFATLDARYRAAVAAARMPGTTTNPGSGEAKPLSDASTELSCPGGQPNLAGRLAELETGILGLLERGDKAIERTITCKAWLDEQVNKP